MRDLTSKNCFPKKTSESGPNSAERLFGGCIAELLADCSRVFGGDLQQLRILAFVVQEHLAAIVRHGRVEATPSGNWISASHLAAISGIPRETVRRKLHLLAEKGCVQQGENGSWRFVPDSASPAWRDIVCLYVRSRRRLAGLIASLEAHPLRDLRSQ